MGEVFGMENVVVSINDRMGIFSGNWTVDK
jgi:hypothetical protein